MNLTALAILGILAMILLVFLGMNMGMSMFFIGLVGYTIASGSFTKALYLFRTVPYTNSSSFSLAVVPLFILMGTFALQSGMSKGLYDCCEKWMGKFPGGLSFATIVACAGFGAICGSTSATVATMGKLALPEMKRFGYDDGFSAATAAAGGTLGYLIPPSTGFILYGIVATASVGRLFAAGIIPGLLLMFAYVIAAGIACKMNPSMAPRGGSYSIGEKVKSLKGLIPIIVLFGAVVGGMFSGIFSANEAAACGAFLAMLYALIRRKLNFKSLIECLTESVKSTAMVYQMMLGAYIFGYFLTITNLPQNLATTVGSLDINRYLVMLMIIAVYIILGMIMDSIAIILVTVPIFLPVATGLGFDPIWFGVVIVMMMCTGCITPPIGLNVFIAAGVSKGTPLTKIFRGVLPYVFAIVIISVLVVLFPPMSTWLPNLIYGPA